MTSRWFARKAWPSLRSPLVGSAVGAFLLGLAGACLERPVAPLEPQTNNEFIDQVTLRRVNKIDLLFMIDNSTSMLDKQQILADAVPLLMRRLVTPVCIDPVTNNRGNFSDSLGRCTEPGYNPEFPPVTDIHIGIITSSLGDHGLNTFCNAALRAEYNDRAHLLGTVRSGLPSWNGSGFLSWDPGVINTPPGETNVATLNRDFSNHVTSAKDTGCGFEASLEAWYRFLIDPEPPLTLSVDTSKPAQTQVVEGIDEQLLAQRRAFLRPESLVAIIMLTDENDCSVIEETGAQGQLIGTRQPLPRSASKCENPNDPCCLSCVVSWPDSCGDRDADPECSKGPLLSESEERTNLRCYENKRRYGFDLLYPVERYIEGLTSPTVSRRSDGARVPNPLFISEGKTRGAQLVFFAGIVGVPWQDIAADPTGASRLRYLTAKELAEQQRWEVILGDPRRNDPSHRAPVPPLDPLMQESPFPRQGTNPIIGAPLVSEDSSDPYANPVNGHEFKLYVENRIEMQDDLQYACIFPIANNPCEGNRQCDCASDSEIAQNKPLCQNPNANGAMQRGFQYFAKAYPGLRHLEVLKGFGQNAIVASICPKELANPEKPDFGYYPAVDAIVDRLKEQLTGKCLPRPLAQDPVTGKVPCTMIEAVHKPGSSCGCDKPGRGGSGDKVSKAVREYLLSNNLCGGDIGKECSDFCFCEILQLSDAGGEACRRGDPVETPGYCYIDENTPGVTPEVLADCSATEKRKLRFVYPLDVPDAEIPAPDAVNFIACIGAAVGAVD